jgi:hypothetical protein
VAAAAAQGEGMRQGYLIQDRACPRCANRRTVRLGQGSSLCFNCRYHWDPEPVELMPAGWSFDAAERSRLVIYRAAVRAGFYSD